MDGHIVASIVKSASKPNNRVGASHLEVKMEGSFMGEKVKEATDHHDPSRLVDSKRFKQF